MKEIEDLLKASLGEIEKMLQEKNVVGAPIQIEGVTLIPLVSMGFGFGVGGGSGKDPKAKGEGNGLGAAGGGGIKPVAMVVIDKEGARLISIRSGVASMAEAIAEAIGSLKKEKEESGR